MPDRLWGLRERLKQRGLHGALSQQEAPSGESSEAGGLTLQPPPEKQDLGGAQMGQGGGRGLGDAGWRWDLGQPGVEGGVYFGGLEWEKPGSV